MSNFKVHLMRESDDDSERLIKIETRRLYCNFTTFSKLRDDLTKFFPMLTDQSFSIKWKDNDSDMITISSDEELNIFLQEVMKAQIMYVIIKNTKHSGTQPKAEAGTSKLYDIVHPRIVCDACEKTVHGFRYKCLVCPDYDLCSACEAKGCHPEHYMIRTATPVIWNRRCMPRFSRRFMRHAKKAAKSQEEEKNPRSSCRDEEQSSWVENLVQILTDWANIPTEPAKDDVPETAEAAKEEPKAAKSPTSVLNDLRQSPLCDNVIYKMQNLLDNSLQFLDPLGVDVSINLQPEGTTIHLESPKHGSQSPTKENSPNPAPEAPKTSENVGTGTAESTGNSVNGSRKSSAGSTENIAKPLDMTQSKVPNKMERDCDDYFSTLSYKLDKTLPNRSNAEIEGWTLLNVSESPNSSLSKPEADNKPSAPKETEKPLYPPLPQKPEVEPLYHPDPKIHRAVHAMMEMGFSNDGGWLTQLLISKSGDISKALDVLQPVRQ